MVPARAGLAPGTRLAPRRRSQGRGAGAGLPPRLGGRGGRAAAGPPLPRWAALRGLRDVPVLGRDAPCAQRGGRAARPPRPRPAGDVTAARCQASSEITTAAALLSCGVFWLCCSLNLVMVILRSGGVLHL